MEREKEREKKEQGKLPVSRHQAQAKKAGRHMSEAVKGRIFEAWRTLERMVNLNIYDDIAKGIILIELTLRAI